MVTIHAQMTPAHLIVDWLGLLGNSRLTSSSRLREPENEPEAALHEVSMQGKEAKGSGKGI